MIGLDTNVLARYYIQDEADAEARRQHEAARNLIESGDLLMVCKIALLELERVMRGYYGFSMEEITGAFSHLLALEHVHIEDRASVAQALSHMTGGLDFADAPHLAAYRECLERAS